MAKISLTGIKPTGTPHLGNYLGSIQPALELAKDYLSVYFIADWHALTTVRENGYTDGKEQRALIHKLAATWLACGLDPAKTVFFQQSRVPELAELNWYLACFAPKGLLNRAHGYKAMVDANKEKGDDPDAGIYMGLYTYPVLMAADILLFGSDVVPVGQDQKQHVEIARDIAVAANNQLGSIFNVPEPLIREDVKTIPGLDGRKMSKSYDNVIPFLAPPAEMKKAVMRIVTDSKRPEEPKDADQDNVFNIFKHFASAERVAERRKQYAAGGVGYGEMKEELLTVLEERFGAARKHYDELLKDAAGLDKILEEGAERARQLAGKRMEKLRKKLGLRG
jgi:tryptophanyl-tRNA synthetase